MGNRNNTYPHVLIYFDSSRIYISFEILKKGELKNCWTLAYDYPFDAPANLRK